MSRAETACCDNSVPGLSKTNNKPSKRTVVVLLGYTTDQRRRYNEEEGRNFEEAKDVKKVGVIEKGKGDEVENEDDGVDEEKPMVAISSIHIIINSSL